MLLFIRSYSIVLDPILSYPILSYPILSYPILSYPILSYPILSYPILFYPILSYYYRILSYFILSHPILLYPILSCSILFYPTLSYLINIHCYAAHPSVHPLINYSFIYLSVTFIRLSMLSFYLIHSFHPSILYIQFISFIKSTSLFQSIPLIDISHPLNPFIYPFSLSFLLLFLGQFISFWRLRIWNKMHSFLKCLTKEENLSLQSQTNQTSLGRSEDAHSSFSRRHRFEIFRMTREACTCMISREACT